jgi:preprotein translocase subunit SecG
LIYVLYVLEVIVCLFLILVVLLQQGSGADLSVFGGGATQTAFGARGTTQFIHKLTVWAFVAFILLTLTIAVMKAGGGGGSVITGADPAEIEEPTGGARADVPPPGAGQAEAPAASETTQMMVETAPEGDAAADAVPGTVPAEPAAPAPPAPQPSAPQGN